jgi:hypothetical protein
MQENTDPEYQTLPVQHYSVPIAVLMKGTVPVLLSKEQTQEQVH